MDRREQIRTAAEEKTRGVGGNWEHIRKGAELWFIRGAIWADSHPHWIPVEERLPEKEDDYLVLDCKRRVVAAFDPSDKTWWESDGNCIVSVFPTHWMPMPQAPRKED